jgi:hypothetical protein
VAGTLKDTIDRDYGRVSWLGRGTTPLLFSFSSDAGMSHVPSATSEGRRCIIQPYGRDNEACNDALEVVVVCLLGPEGD